MTTKTKTINGLAFEISQPYEAGQTINEAEAKALNQTRSENIGNNLRAKVKEMADAGSEHAAIAQIVAEADAAYVFTLAAVSTSAKLDPYEREAQKLAKELIKSSLAAKGRKLTDVPEGVTEDEWKAKVQSEVERIAATDNVVKAARKAVDAKKKQGEALLEGLGSLDV